MTLPIKMIENTDLYKSVKNKELYQLGEQYFKENLEVTGLVQIEGFLISRLYEIFQKIEVHQDLEDRIKMQLGDLTFRGFDLRVKDLRRDYLEEISALKKEKQHPLVEVVVKQGIIPKGKGSDSDFTCAYYITQIPREQFHQFSFNSLQLKQQLEQQRKQQLKIRSIESS